MSLAYGRLPTPHFISPELRDLDEARKARQERLSRPAPTHADVDALNAAIADLQGKLAALTPAPPPPPPPPPAPEVIETDALRERVSRCIAEATRAFDAKPCTPAAALVRNVVAEFYGVSVPLLIGERRSRQIVRKRQAAIYLINEMCPHMSTPAIGRMFNRDHTTVLHSINRIAEFLLTDAELVAALDAMRSTVAERHRRLAIEQRSLGLMAGSR